MDASSSTLRQNTIPEATPPKWLAESVHLKICYKGSMYHLSVWSLTAPADHSASEPRPTKTVLTFITQQAQQLL